MEYPRPRCKRVVDVTDFNDNIGVPRVSELPEKIWAWFFIATKREEGIIDGGWCSEFDRKETEYVRADVAAAQLAEAQAREADVLNAALDAIHNAKLQDHYDDGGRIHFDDLQDFFSDCVAKSLKTEPTP